MFWVNWLIILNDYPGRLLTDPHMARYLNLRLSIQQPSSNTEKLCFIIGSDVNRTEAIGTVEALLSRT